MNLKTNLIGLPRDAFTTLLKSKITFRHSYTPLQIFEFIYKKGITDFDQISNISKEKRLELNTHFSLGYPQNIQLFESVKDGTCKFLMQFDGPKSVIESVFIPSATVEDDMKDDMNNIINKIQRDSNESKDFEGTVCVSSQVGCALACTFCHTGSQKFQKNLSSSEITSQVMHIMHHTRDLPLQQNVKRNVKNIVFMGQGEPLLNYKNVKDAIHVLTDKKGLAFTPWRITLSTSGIVPLIENVSKQLKCALAISLHAVRNDARDILVPINKQYPIQELLKACQLYLNHVPSSRHKRITFEYVMLDKVNDSLADARELKSLLHKLPAHVNLIPFNPWPGSSYKCSNTKTIHEFKSILEQARIPCTIRVTKGQDIMAACGQLKSLNISKKSVV